MHKPENPAHVQELPTTHTMTVMRHSLDGGTAGTFGYRIGARLAPEDRLLPYQGNLNASEAKSIAEAPVLTATAPNGTWYVITAVPQNVPIANASQFAIYERGFPSAERAESRGRQVIEALRVAGVLQRVGLDLGDSRSVAETIPSGKQYIVNLSNPTTKGPAQQSIIPHLGLHVFEDGPALEFMSVDSAQRNHPVRLNAVLGSTEMHIDRLGSMTPKQKTSCELLHAVRFEFGPRARFVLAVPQLRRCSIRRNEKASPWQWSST
jgi:hypothetical protein